jgi:hypothetical protein
MMSVRVIRALAAGVAVALGLGACRGPDPVGPFRSELTLADEPAELLLGAGTLAASADPEKPGVLIAPRAGEHGAVLTGPPIIDAGMPFSEALVSWNVDVPAGAGARLEVRVGRSGGPAVVWSPYLFIGEWGDVPPGGEKVVSFDRLSSDGGGATFAGAAGKVDTDFFVSEETFDAIQYRVLASCTPEQPVRLERVAVTRTDVKSPLGGACVAAGCADGLDQEALSPVAIPVPFRSQRTTTPELSGRLCSPTSVTMVMAYRGVDLPLDVVAQAVYDKPHDIYGNWPRNVQAAYALGVPGHLRRYSDWSQVMATFQSGTPIIASIAVKPGELRGAPYKKTAGHLIVLRGFDKEGRVLVNDPAAGTARTGMLAYRREDLERVWLRRNAGTAYVLGR